MWFFRFVGFLDVVFRFITLPVLGDLGNLTNLINHFPWVFEIHYVSGCGFQVFQVHVVIGCGFSGFQVFRLFRLFRLFRFSGFGTGKPEKQLSAT